MLIHIFVYLMYYVHKTEYSEIAWICSIMGSKQTRWWSFLDQLQDNSSSLMEKVSKTKIKQFVLIYSFFVPTCKNEK